VISLQCAHCSKNYRVPEKYAGKKIRCPQCTGIIPVPAPEPEDSPLGGLAGFLDSELASGPAVADPRPRAAAARDDSPIEATVCEDPRYNAGRFPSSIGYSSYEQNSRKKFSGGSKKVLYIAGGVLLGLTLLLVVGSSDRSAASGIFFGLCLVSYCYCTTSRVYGIGLRRS
jgi:hypothetical protein